MPGIDPAVIDLVEQLAADLREAQAETSVA